MASGATAVHSIVAKTIVAAVKTGRSRMVLRAAATVAAEIIVAAACGAMVLTIAKTSGGALIRCTEAPGKTIGTRGGRIWGSMVIATKKPGLDMDRSGQGRSVATSPQLVRKIAGSVVDGVVRRQRAGRDYIDG